MKGFKLLIALALFVTSVSFENQLLVTDQGMDSTWEITVNTNHAMALEFE